MAGRNLESLQQKVRVPCASCCLSPHQQGHAIESRLYAEDPANNFFPCTGKILLWRQAPTSHQGYPRYDTGVETGSTISVYYDPLIAKITTWAPTRDLAIQAMDHALRKTVCLGLVTNKRFLIAVLRRSEFIQGSYTTRLAETMFADPAYNNVDPLIKTSLVDLPMLATNSPHLQWIPGSDEYSAVTSSSQVSLSSWPLSDEVAAVATMFLWYHRVQQRTKLRLLPSSWRTIRWRSQQEKYNIGKETSSPVIVQYVQHDITRPSGPWSFIMRIERGEKAEKTRNGWVEVILTRVQLEEGGKRTNELWI